MLTDLIGQIKEAFLWLTSIVLCLSLNTLQFFIAQITHISPKYIESAYDIYSSYDLIPERNGSSARFLVYIGNVT